MPEGQWSESELFQELRAFETALREAGLRETSIQTYVGRSDTFLRWLAGEYTPRGANDTRDEHAGTSQASLGTALLEELGESLERARIARYLADYAAVTGYDRALRSVNDTLKGSANLELAEHRVAILGWLRAWGCRHLRRTDTDQSSTMLLSWWHQWGRSLPDQDSALASLNDDSRQAAGEAYDALARAPTAGRTLKDREVSVVFGDTAAAKTLFFLRPAVFPPWDDPIRLAFGWPKGGGAAYAHFLAQARDAVRNLTSRLGVPVEQLPAELDRPYSSPAKIIDEYLWIRITRAL